MDLRGDVPRAEVGDLDLRQALRADGRVDAVRGDEHVGFDRGTVLQQHGDRRVGADAVAGDLGTEVHGLLQAEVEDAAQGRAAHHQMFGNVGGHAGALGGRPVAAGAEGELLVEEEHVLARHAAGRQEQLPQAGLQRGVQRGGAGGVDADPVPGLAGRDIGVAFADGHVQAVPVQVVGQGQPGESAAA